MKTIDDYRTRTISNADAELSIEITAPGFTYQYTTWVTKEFPISTEEVRKLVSEWVNQHTPDDPDRKFALSLIHINDSIRDKWSLQDL